MEKIKEKINKYEVSINLKSNGYYMARISFKLGGGPSPRLEKSGTTEELALKSLLDKLIDYIDTSFKNGLITSKIDDIVSQRLMKSINNLNITSSEIMEKTLTVVSRINHINSCILNNISLHSNVIPFYNRNSVPSSNTSNLVPFHITPNINPTAAPTIHNITNNVGYEPVQQIIIEDLAIEWLKYRQSLCKTTEDNPEPLSRKTLDINRNRLKNDILPYLKKNKILYLSQLTDECIKSLLKSIKSQNSKHKSYETLNLLFKYAINEKHFKDNPVLRVDKPPEKIKTAQEDDDNYIESDRQNLWLDLFEKEHRENHNNPNHLHRDIALLFEIMLLTRHSLRRGLPV